MITDVFLSSRVALGLDGIVKNINNTRIITEKSVSLGKRHQKHNVKPHYFDVSIDRPYIDSLPSITVPCHTHYFQSLGEVLIKVISNALNMEGTDPTIIAWTKAYGVIATNLKKGLTETE